MPPGKQPGLVSLMVGPLEGPEHSWRAGVRFRSRQEGVQTASPSRGQGW